MSLSTNLSLPLTLLVNKNNFPNSFHFPTYQKENMTNPTQQHKLCPIIQSST